jgi:aminoglycoside phosphotransferase (APT) family kinase protein
MTLPRTTIAPPNRVRGAVARPPSHLSQMPSTGFVRRSKHDSERNQFISESSRPKSMPIDESLVRRLLTAQFPQWAHLPITPAIPQGWDNRTFRLGEEMSVRLPSAAEYVPQVAKIHRYLPLLAPLLPLPIPLPLAQGEPGEGYPFPWSIFSWLPGETAVTAPSLDLSEMAHALADFLIALAQIDATGGPTSGQHSAFRGGSLALFDAETRQAIQALSTTINGPLALAIWEAARATSWEGTPVWFHGDVASPNLLVQQGSLSAVIDWGCAGVGDPACDLVIAWTLFTGESRREFRTALPWDEPVWARARGWALWNAVILVAGHSTATAWEVANSRNSLNDLLQEASSVV